MPGPPPYRRMVKLNGIKAGKVLEIGFRLADIYLKNNNNFRKTAHLADGEIPETKLSCRGAKVSVFTQGGGHGAYAQSRHTSATDQYENRQAGDGLY